MSEQYDICTYGIEHWSDSLSMSLYKRYKISLVKNKNKNKRYKYLQKISLKNLTRENHNFYHFPSSKP
jgi:hypothetical protein